MPNNSPLWHCYECNAEMRPLMMPDPHCASCNSTFVEMIENTEDDPRRFQTSSLHQQDLHDHEENFYSQGDGPLGGSDPFQFFQLLMGGLGGPQRRSSIRVDRRSGADVEDTTGDFRSSGGPIFLGGSPRGGSGFVFTTGGGSSRGGVDTLPGLNSLFSSGPPSPGGRAETMPPPFLHHVLLSMFGAPMQNGRDGQFGDYVMNNDALDQIISQLMEQSNGDKPVPAPDYIINALPRSKVAAGSELLEKDCAVCKDSFEVSQEAIMLPCHHSFHDECILPWIKSSGTCPVCRHELVPQPKHNHGPPGSSSDGAGSGPSMRRTPTSNSSGGGGGGGGGRRFPGAWDALD